MALLITLQVIIRFVAVFILHNTIIFGTAELTDYVIKGCIKDTEHGFFLYSLMIDLLSLRTNKIWLMKSIWLLVLMTPILSVDIGSNVFLERCVLLNVGTKWILIFNSMSSNLCGMNSCIIVARHGFVAGAIKLH